MNGAAAHGAEGTRAERRAAHLLAVHHDSIAYRCDRAFAWLMATQWLFALGTAALCTPYTWDGAERSIHVHVWAALLGGAALTAPVVALAWRMPGRRATRHAIAVAQVLWSALLIHLTGGRIETHFHVFVSLAFLAFYRDWTVLLTATAVFAADHLLRGHFAPGSVYGVADPGWLRFLEHAIWVLFEDVVLVVGIVESRKEMAALAAREAELEAARATVEGKVVERTRELASSREQYRALVETTQAIPWELDRDEWRFTWIGPQCGRMLGVSAEQWLDARFWDERVHPDDRSRAREKIERAADHPGKEVEFRLVREDGTTAWVRVVVADARDDRKLRGLLLDMTQRRQLEGELQQSQKLESVGRLAAGIAHEINTPVQFVGDSLHFVRDATRDVMELVGRQRVASRAVLDGVPPAQALALARAAAAAEEEADLPYLAEHLPKALDRAVEGLDRVTTIVRSMKAFAHPDQKAMAAVDLNQAIRSTLVIARHEWKYVAELDAQLGDLPPVVCHAGDVNQAVLNIVVNAAHAIGDVVRGSDRKGLITVRTRVDGEWIEITIGDTGGGIPEEIRGRVFDPFFTTKEVGRGTGQGLAIARAVVVDRHGGALWFESEVGRGTTFFLRLPVAGVVEPAPEPVEALA